MESEQPRPDATSNERSYTLTIDDVAQLYEAAGHARTKRSIQKYCVRGDLDCIKEETQFGQRYRISRESVERHIAQIEQLSQTYGREQTRPDAAVPLAVIEETNSNEVPAPLREQTRPDAATDRYIARLEDDVVFLRQQIAQKDNQILSRDSQIQAMIERDRETNILFSRMLPQLGNSNAEGEGSRSTNNDQISDASGA